MHATNSSLIISLRRSEDKNPGGEVRVAGESYRHGLREPVLPSIDLVSANYRDLDAANESERQEWLPALLPPSSQHIRVVWDVDVQKTWLQFRFTDVAVKSDDGCVSVAESEVRFPKPRRGVRRWPNALTRSYTLDRAQFEFFDCTAHRDGWPNSGQAFLALNDVEKRGYWWRSQ